MADLRDELDASLLFGSGYICVVGPPSSGKTTLVLHYLVARERLFQQQALSTSADVSPAFCLEYMSARSASNELLRCFMRRLHPTARRQRRLSYECSPLEFGASLIQWLEAQPEKSELHLVVDDADMLGYEPEDMNLWLSHCLCATAAQTRRVVLWMISELPVRLDNCFRYHFVARPDPQCIVQWLQRQFEEERRLRVAGQESDDAALEESEELVGDTHRSEQPVVTVVSADDVNRVVLDAFTYYATHQPMRSSVVCRDVRLLIHRVYQLLPPLLLRSFASQPPTPAAASTGVAAAAAPPPPPIPPAASRQLNALHFASAWGQYRSDGAAAPASSGSGSSNALGGADRATTTAVAGAGASSSAGQQDPLVVALKRLGYSAVLLAFASFYGGAVPKRKQHQVFGHMASSGERKAAQQHESKGQSHKAAVLSASAHIITMRRLAYLYEAILRMCTPHIDPLEFSSADVALQYVQGFVAWGLLTPVVSQQRHRAYHCWIPVSTAQQLARELSVNLFDLIPT